MKFKAVDALSHDLRGARRDGGRLFGRLGDVKDHAGDLVPELTRQARSVLDTQVEQLRAQGRDAASSANDQLDAARGYVIEHVRDQPLIATLAVLGLGVLFGLALSGSRR